MGKFDGTLIVTDLDGTLLSDDKLISSENKNAIEYFISEGGYFTIATGRSKQGINSILEQITPNAPVIIFNGAALYDTKKDKIIWETFLDENAQNVFKLVEYKHPYSGIEVFCKDNIYVSRGNELMQQQLAFENISEKYLHFSKITEPMRKALFVQDEDKLQAVREEIAASPYGSCYNFMQSSSYYYEILPKDASKGIGLLKLAKILDIPQSKTIGIGDNENDISLIRNAGVGVAVANALPSLLDIADFISTDNNSHSISTIIYGIDKKIIEI